MSKSLVSSWKFWVALAGGLVCFVIICVIALLLWLRHQALSFTAEKPKALQEIVIDDETRLALEAKLAAFEASARERTGKATEFTVDELNQLIVSRRETQDVADKLRIVSIADNTVTIDFTAAIPADVPVVGGRFVNALCTLALELTEDGLQVVPKVVKVADRDLSEGWTDARVRAEIDRAIGEDPKLQDAMRQLSELSLRDGRLYLRAADPL